MFSYHSLLILLEIVFPFVTSTLERNHIYDSEGHKHLLDDDHLMFLGKERKDEFDSLSYEEAGRRLRLLIPHIDMNKDGFLDMEELKIWIQHQLKPFDDKEDVEKLFRESDENNNLLVTWDEFTSRHYGFTDSSKDGLSEEKKSIFGTFVKRDRRRWRYADINKDGDLTWKEFEYFQHPTEHRAMIRLVAIEELEEYDEDKDGFLSMEEYLKSCGVPMMKVLDMKRFHDELDKDHDGKLSLDEIEHWKTPEEFDEPTREAKHLLEAADRNEDGKLSVDEITQNQVLFVGSILTFHGKLLHEEF